MSLKRKLSFDELVSENRQQILKDRLLMEKIEQNIEKRINKNTQNQKEAQ
ncbi:FbpB family small basic protein [Virgibacillus oceani]